MNPVNVHLRLAEGGNSQKIDTLAREGNLIYSNDGSHFKAHLKTLVKFAVLTAASPLIALARLVRSIVFAFAGDMNRAGREFIGAIATPLVAGFCCTGSLFSSVLHVISCSEISFYVSMRRTYAHFEAWTNNIDLKSRDLPSYSHRVSGPANFVGSPLNKHIWTTAPCMQPLLENGSSPEGGLRDLERIKRIYPFYSIDGVSMENGNLVLDSFNVSKSVHYTACNGAVEHSRAAFNCCCCYRIEAAYDRVLCCQVGQGSCTSRMDPGDSCGIVSVGACGLNACCCYVRENNETTHLSTAVGCCGTQGSYCATNWDKMELKDR